MPKVTEEYRTARRAEITAAALACFRRKGFDATSMADIIAESGLSAGAIYGHFSGKEDLTLATVQGLLGSRVAEFEELLEHDELPAPGTLVETFLRGLQREIGDVSVLVQIWASASVSSGMRVNASLAAETIRATLGRYYAAWHRQHGDVPDDEIPDRSAKEALVTVGICQGFVVQHTLFAGFDADAYFAAARAVLPH